MEEGVRVLQLFETGAASCGGRLNFCKESELVYTHDAADVTCSVLKGLKPEISEGELPLVINPGQEQEMHPLQRVLVTNGGDPDLQDENGGDQDHQLMQIPDIQELTAGDTVYILCSDGKDDPAAFHNGMR